MKVLYSSIKVSRENALSKFEAIWFHILASYDKFQPVSRSMINIILYISQEFKVKLQNCISLFQMLLCKFIYYFFRQFHFLANFFVHSLRFAINFSIHTQSVLIWKYFLDFFENQKTSLHNASRFEKSLSRNNANFENCWFSFVIYLASGIYGIFMDIIENGSLQNDIEL